MTKTYYTIINLLVLSAIIYIGVDSFYKVVEFQLSQVDVEKPTAQRISSIKRMTKVPIRDYQSILSRNIFGSIDQAEKKVDTSEVETLEPTALKVTLLGTVTGDEKHAYAVIEETSKRKQSLYRIGDSVQNAVLKMILREKVVLRVDDRDEVLEMKEPSSSKSTPSRSSRTSSRTSRAAPRPRTITVDRSDMEAELADINKILSQARIRPHFQDGQSDGLTITGIKAGSIFRKMGLRNGDIIHGINGDPIQSPEDVFGMYDSMKSGSNISIQIKRRGRETTLNYQFRE